MSKTHPLAIAMWDFSWIERRWPGAGYEDWDEALDGLLLRGYDAVRIDAFPHLIWEDKDREWMLLPVWYSNDWGSPWKINVKLNPALIDFLKACRNRHIKVGLSSWFREDTDNIRMKLATPERMAQCWLDTLTWIRDCGLMDTILYVDLCNEWPGDFWAPYFKNDPEWMTWSCWHTETSMRYMRGAIEIVRKSFPDLPYCFSFDGENTHYYRERDLSFFDLAEHHIWAAKLNDQEFYRQVGQAKNGRFSEEPYHLLADHALDVYEQRPEYWQELLKKGIHALAADAKAAGLVLATTECWGIVDYKDYPMLPWKIVTQLCEVGVKTAADCGQWALLATSNFTGPQFCGIWRDIQWHRQLTDIIHQAQITADLSRTPLRETMLWHE